ncbi:hypothetical protein [Deinococcus hohokamensis]|uniref:Uncharacterized protein n=1 Tax=Deinococcus hohokamensis TaxID=309883 RepID=A0ABV9I9W9_9DEIO
MRKALIIAALTLLPAGQLGQAQTVSTNIDARVQFPPAIQTLANVVNLLSQGVRVSFLTPTAQPAATVSPSGSLVVRPGITTTATQVQVMTPIPGSTEMIREIYPLAQPLNLSQTVAPQSITVKAKDGRTLPLTSVMGRQAAWAKAPGLQKKPGQMPPGQLKKLCKATPTDPRCAQR